MSSLTLPCPYPKLLEVLYDLHTFTRNPQTLQNTTLLNIERGMANLPLWQHLGWPLSYYIGFEYMSHISVVDLILCHLFYAKQILGRFFPGNTFLFYFMPISLCPPINGIISEFMPDRHKTGRPTLSRFDMKSDRYCVEPVCVWILFVPRDQFDMRACRK